MSSSEHKITPDDLRARKGSADPIVCLTAYTAPMAARLDPYCDLLLVGDSLGNVLYGMENTLGVTLDMMINHGKAVTRRAAKTCVVVDMPYGTYENSARQAYESAKRIMDETGCDAVKLEGGEDMAETITYLTSRDIPVMGHIGLQPQSVEKEGGYRIKGRTDESEKQLMADAKAVEEAGAFSMVLEGTLEDVSERVVAATKIPVIGIGASASCDGQILVTDDMIGLLDGHVPKFVKFYAQIGDIIEAAVESYADDVKARRFPGAEHVYARPDPTKQKKTA